MRKRWKPWLLAALALPSMAAAQFAPQGRKPDADPALWVVKDADTTIYLFGTFHLLDGKIDWFNDEVRRAFDESEELRLEIILPEDDEAIAPLVERYATDPKRKLSSKLKPETWRQLREVMAEQQVPATALERFKPWFIGNMLTVAALRRVGLSPDLGAEMVLTHEARASGKPVTQLETIEIQLRMLDSMPEPMQVAFLEQSLTETQAAAEMLQPMLAAWASGDSETLGTMMSGAGEAPELHKLIFSDRNARWAGWISGRMAKPGTVFIAVGAGHLAGQDSVQQLLRAKGLQAERVE